MSVSRRREIFDELSAGRLTGTEAAFMYMKNELAGLNATIDIYLQCSFIGKHPMEVAWSCFMWKSGFDDVSSLENDRRYQSIKEDFYREHTRVDRDCLRLFRLEMLWLSKAAAILSLEESINSRFPDYLGEESAEDSDAL